MVVRNKPFPAFKEPEKPGRAEGGRCNTGLLEERAAGAVWEELRIGWTFQQKAKDESMDAVWDVQGGAFPSEK